MATFDKEQLQNALLSRLSSDEQLEKLAQKVNRPAATYADVAAYSERAGKICAEFAKQNLTARISAEDADALIETVMKIGHKKVADAAYATQAIMNEQAGLGLASQRPRFHPSQSTNLAKHYRTEVRRKPADEVKKDVSDSIELFCRKVVDDSVKANANFQARVGLNPLIRRKVAPGCCKWCTNLGGQWDYGHEPKDVYRRHKHCACLVEFFPGDGKRQNVHSKEIYSDESDLDRRKTIHTDERNEARLPHNIKNVKDKYFKKATPGEGKLTFGKGFVEKDFPEEVAIAKLLFDKFGGDIELIARSDTELRPDFSWNGRLWDLKTTQTEKGANSALRHGLKQIEKNPGGIVFNYEDRPVNVDTFLDVVSKRAAWAHYGIEADIILVQNSSITNIFRVKTSEKNK